MQVAHSQRIALGSCLHDHHNAHVALPIHMRTRQLLLVEYHTRRLTPRIGNNTAFLVISGGGLKNKLRSDGFRSLVCSRGTWGGYRSGACGHCACLGSLRYVGLGMLMAQASAWSHALPPANCLRSRALQRRIPAIYDGSTLVVILAGECAYWRGNGCLWDMDFRACGDGSLDAASAWIDLCDDVKSVNQSGHKNVFQHKNAVEKCLFLIGVVDIMSHR